MNCPSLMIRTDRADHPQINTLGYRNFDFIKFLQLNLGKFKNYR
jgi:hypothetical protein